VVITVGIDLAAQDKDTAACRIEWSGGGASVSVPDVGLADDALVDRVISGDRVGIDAPFGCPDEFVRRSSPTPTLADSRPPSASGSGTGRPTATSSSTRACRCRSHLIGSR
jgi:Protein of unknown function (DUF429)